jgi:hypothetical protein
VGKIEVQKKFPLFLRNTKYCFKSTLCSTFAANNMEKEVEDSKTEFQLGTQA